MGQWMAKGLPGLYGCETGFRSGRIDFFTIFIISTSHQKNAKICPGCGKTADPFDKKRQFPGSLP
jgi:hypothetical protein